MIRCDEVNFSQLKIVVKGGKCENILTLDTETTSIFIDDNGKAHTFNKRRSSEFYKKCVKIGYVYIWTLGIDDQTIYGRDLESLFFFLIDLRHHVKGAKTIIYVHNLGYDFQFLRNILIGCAVFARKKRRPIYVRWKNYEFRCSYFLTRLSLDKWAKGKKLAVQKLVGDLDYTKMRTPLTRLSDAEKKYCENDVLVMYHGLRQFVDEYGSVHKIPLTQTGCVRKDFNDLLRDRSDLHNKMDKLVIRDLDFFRVVLRCLWGGIAHASALYADRTLDNVDSWDIKSSYPYVMVAEKYPSSPFFKDEPNYFFFDSAKYCYIIHVIFFDLASSLCHSFLSISRCVAVKGAVDDNGRVDRADMIEVYCTDIDYCLIKDSYTFSGEEIVDFWVATKDYLDEDICRFIIESFNNKTTLDGVEGMESMYAKSKERTNSIFGMMITRLITDDIVYSDDEWQDDVKLNEELFNEKTKSILRKKKKLNTSFTAGVWITAYARRNLWASVVAVDGASVYLDTDSNKMVHGDLFRSFFDEYNAGVLSSHYAIARRLGIDAKLLHPTRPDGKVCALGVYEYEGTYKHFKTLGAKKYCYEDDNGLHITVAGVRKEAAKQLNSIDDFKNGFVFDIDNAKKLALYYNDDQPSIIINPSGYDKWECTYKCGICAMPTTYKLGMTDDYIDMIYDALTHKSDLLF